MGWGRTLLLGTWGNRLDLDDAERKAERLRRKLRLKDRQDRAQDERLDALEQENEQLKAGLVALSQLLVSKGVLEQADLENLAASIDLDGEEPEDAD